MKILVILAHPNAHSFCHAIASASVEKLKKNRHEVYFHDLYKEEFDPVLTAGEFQKNAILSPQIQQHCDETAEADGFIVVHPNWWGQPPAILKGWIDRVIRPGVAYEFLEGDDGEGIPRGLLKAKSAIVFNTSNTGIEREKRMFADPLETIWKNCIFGLCGVHKFHREMFSIVVTSTEKQRDSWLRDIVKTVDEYYPQIQ